MLKQRIRSAAVSFAVLYQMTAGAFAALPAQAAQTQKKNSLSFAAFAERVQNTLRGDAERDFYQEIVYDPANGTLSQDGGTAASSAGELCVRNGRLMLDTGANSGAGNGIRTLSRFADFSQCGAEYGYRTETQDGKQIITNDFQTARLIVKAAGSIDPHGAEQVTEGWNDLHILQYADSADAYAAFRLYENDPDVAYVQPSRRTVLDTGDADMQAYELPDSNHNTWGADVIGTDSFIAEYLNAELLPEIKVAVLDTGINPVPALFEGRILDGGINVSDSGDDTAADDLYHGTHVSGTICELTPSNVKILPVKIFDKNGSAADEQIYLGILYALEQGADILNMSFGGLGVSPLEVEAMSIADEQGVICCTSSGNKGDDASYYYPGGIESCITVGAVDRDNQRAPFSNYGKTVDVTAPGVGIVSYVLGNKEKLEAKNGTSMATPHVTACCALLKSYDKSVSPRRAEALIRLNAVDLGAPGFDSDYGWGLVNMRDFRWDDGICFAPEFSLKPGNFGTPQTVAISTETGSADIYYTTDGSLPSRENGIRYTEPVVITETTWLRAVTVREGFLNSVASEAVYAIGGLDTADAWEISDGVLLRYRGVSPAPKLPAETEITSVAANAFADNHFIRQVTLPDSVTEIGDSAFENCILLENVTAKGVSVIGERAFAESPQLSEVILSSRFTSVGAGAFRGCTALKEMTLSGIPDIPSYCFAECSSLRAVSMPDAVSIGNCAFFRCSSLRDADCRWDKITKIGNSAFSDCTVWNGDLRLMSLDELGKAAFSGDRALLRVSLPETVTELPASALAGCSGLRLLQLPGITRLMSESLALGSSRSDLTVELDYGRITEVGNKAFYGFRLGTGSESVSFPALQTLEAYSFSGAQAGGLDFPLITAVPENAFADGSIGTVHVPRAESLAENSIAGCLSVVVYNPEIQIDPHAMPEGTYLVAPETSAAAADLPGVTRISEPLLFTQQKQEVRAEQFTPSPLRVLAGGISLQYQWYAVSGSSAEAIKGAVLPVFYPDTEQTGSFIYRCLITDASGKTEQAEFTLTVSAQTEEPESFGTDSVRYLAGTDQSRFLLTVPESGEWIIRAEGSAPVIMTLSDSTGKEPDSALTGTDGKTVLRVTLDSNAEYYLNMKPFLDGISSLIVTQKEPAAQDLSGSQIQAQAASSVRFGSEYHPKLTVTAPDGTLLTEQTDYIIQVRNHNQKRLITVFGTGAYSGYAELTQTVYDSVPTDTVIPVSLSSAEDKAVCLFIPEKTDRYYYYATSADGYAEEQEAFSRLGSYPGGSRYVKIETSCTIADTPDAGRTVFAYNDYSAATGDYFYSSVKLNAGQPYYFICAAGSAAEYNLVLTRTPYDLRNASIEAPLYKFYTDGVTHDPKITVTLNGKVLQKDIDYQQINLNSDIPGSATVRIVGTGLYLGTAEKNYRMLMMDTDGSEKQVSLNEPVQVTCREQRLEMLVFNVTDAEEDARRYRVLNEKLSGGKILVRLYRYEARSSSFSPISPTEGSDYMLKNGTYYVICYRQYAEYAAAARITVLEPYSLTDAEVTIGNVPYTGSAAPPELTVTAPDGTVLREETDYTILYPDQNILFGETSFVIRPTNTSYGMRMEAYQIEVVLPEDAPFLETGEHSVYLDYQNRLAVYRISADTETAYTLTSSDVPDIVLRVFSPDCEMLGQDYGNGTKSLSFTVPAGETRYLMIKFNGTDRMGTIHFRLDTELRLLSNCETSVQPHFYTGGQITPDVQFRDGDYILEENKDYRLRYTADDVSIGTATANFIGMGSYFGTCDVTFPIVAESLFEIENMESFAVQISQIYPPAEHTGCDYLIYRYTAGTDMDMQLDIFDCMCKLTVQRYDSEGHFADSFLVSKKATEEFEISAGETVYFLFSATDISGWNQTFKFLLNDKSINGNTFKEDPENGVSYRIVPETGYAEVYTLDTEAEKIRLLPEVPGTSLPVRFVPEGLFRDLPENAVVYGYPGCEAAQYADIYHFAYIEIPEKPDTVPQIAGDLNGDGRCSEADLVLLSRIMCETCALELTDAQLEQADLDGDGMIGFRDCQLLLRMISP